MILYWKIRYLDRSLKQFGDRLLYLRTETFDPVTKAAIEHIADSKKLSGERDILKFKRFFQEGDFVALAEERLGLEVIKGFSLVEYFEDEAGNEITIQDMAPILTGDPEAIWFPAGTQQHDIEFATSKLKPKLLSEVTIDDDDLQLLGYFTRDVTELEQSTFYKNGPGILSTWTKYDSKGIYQPVLKTAVNDEEIRSFVMIFRRLYMSGKYDPSNFKDTVGVFAKILGENRHAKWVSGVLREYEALLTAKDHHVPTNGSVVYTFTVKNIIDAFVYTQYAHQPDKSKQRDFNEYLEQVGGKRDLLTWLFLTRIHECALRIVNAGRVIANLYYRYIDYYNINPRILGSLHKDVLGLGSLEKEEVRTARLLQERVEKLAADLWEQAGCPIGGSVQFQSSARDQLLRVLGGERS